MRARTTRFARARAEWSGYSPRLHVTPVNTGVQSGAWIPAFAGMTAARVTPVNTGVHVHPNISLALAQIDRLGYLRVLARIGLDRRLLGPGAAAPTN